MFQKELDNTYRRWFFFFCIGFLIGILFVNFYNGTFFLEEGIFGNTSINRLKYLDVDNGLLFRYVVCKRLKNFLFIGLLSATCFGIAATYACIVWQGLLTGMIITAAVIRFGMKGILLILSVFFPHQFLLFPASIMMLYWSYQNCCFLYFPGKNHFSSFRPQKKQYVRQLLLLFWIIAVVLIGCILESYVNPILLSDILKIF